MSLLTAYSAIELFYSPYIPTKVSLNNLCLFIYPSLQIVYTIYIFLQYAAT